MALNDERGSLPYTELDPDRCPHCGANLIAEPIPDASSDSSSRYRREICVEVPGAQDGILYFVCPEPDCELGWSRFLGGRGEDSMATLARHHVQENNRRVREEAPVVRAAFPSHSSVLSILLASAGLHPVAWRYDPVDGHVKINCEPLADCPAGGHFRTIEVAAGVIVGHPVVVGVRPEGEDRTLMRQSWFKRTEAWPAQTLATP